MSAIQAVMSAAAILAVMTFVKSAGEIVRWARNQRAESERIAKYRRIRDTNYRLWQESGDPVSRAYYAGVYREYADRLMSLESE